MQNKILKGSLWAGGERIVTQLLQIVLSIVIARLLTPADYGVLGIVLVFTIIAQEFIDSGLGSALIYKHDENEKDISTVFTFNIAISAILYAFIYGIAGYVEEFFALANLAKYLRVCALVLFFNSLVVVPTAILKMQQRLAHLSIANFCSAVFSSAIGLYLAYHGYGVWALVGQTLSKSVILFVCLLPFCRTPLRVKFYKSNFIDLYSYSIKLFCATLLSRFVEQMSSFFIGKCFSPHDLGLYTKSSQFAGLPNNSIGNIVLSVLFPTLSAEKNNPERFSQMFRKCIKMQAVISFPAYMAIVMLSEPIITLCLGEKWVEVVPLLQILAAGKVFFLVAITNEHALNALGRSDLFLKQQIVKLLVQSVVLIVMLQFGLMYVVWGLAGYAILKYYITCKVGEKVLNYSIWEQLKDNCQYLIVSALLTVAGILFTHLCPNMTLSVVGASIGFAIFYGLFLFLFDRKMITALLK